MKLQAASQKNLEMHPRGPPFSLNVVATVAAAVGVADPQDALDAVDTLKAVEPETAM